MEEEHLYSVRGPKSWHHMTSQEVGENLRQTGVVFIPAGAIEQHAGHLPLMTDTYAAEEMARRAVIGLKKHGKKAMIGPSIPFGPVANLQFPGSIHIQPTTLILLVKDVCQSLFRDGVRKIVLIVGHDLSAGPLMTAARELVDDLGDELTIVVANWLPLVRRKKLELVSDLIPRGKDDGHGGAGETARMLWLYPNLVVKERIQDYEKDLVELSIPYAYLLAVGGSIDTPRKTTDDAPDFAGIVGYPSVATPAMGDALYEVAGNWLVEIAMQHCF